MQTLHHRWGLNHTEARTPMMAGPWLLHGLEPEDERLSCSGYMFLDVLERRKVTIGDGGADDACFP